MKYACILVLLFLFTKPARAQYSGPVMDSLKKYQQLMERATTTEEKMRLAMQIQKIMMGKSMIDTSALHHVPASKEEALRERDKQVAEINKQRQNIDSSRSRKDKYAAIQKLQARNDSIRTADKNAGQHGAIPEGLITLPNASQFAIDPRAPADTSQVRYSCRSYKKVTNKYGSSIVTFQQNSTTATMYRQNGTITIIATNDALPEYVSVNGMRRAVMVGHRDITGTAEGATGDQAGTSDGHFSFGFYYNPASNQYSVGAAAGLTGNVGSGSFQAINDPSTWVVAGNDGRVTDSGSLIATFTKTPTGYNISYTHSWTGGEDEESGSETFSAELLLVPPRYEAFIEAADTAQYRKWLPQGPSLANYPTLSNGGKGNDIQVKITLWDKLNKKVATDNYTAVIQLNNVSNMPGYCMNFPYDDAVADNKPDMRFERADSTIYANWSENRVRTKTGSGPQYVTVVSYDYGGIADLTADVTTPEGFIIKAHLRNNLRADTLTLPRRSNGSFIADFWKEQESATDKDDRADDEKIESDDRYPGDGLTLYEEYRGFLEKRKHFRGNAGKKDMMICNRIATVRSQNGIDMCESVLNQYGNRVVMHSRFKEDEFGIKHDPDAGELKQMHDRAIHTPIKYDRCINYNNIESLHLVDQHGVVMMFADTALGYAEAVLKVKDIGPPKNYYFLAITRDFSPKPKAWSETNGSIDSLGNIHTGEGGAKILTDEYAVTVAHEILHCFHIRHHGDAGHLGLFSFRYSIAAGKWMYDKVNGQQYVTPAGGPIPADIRWEDDPDHPIAENDPQVHRFWDVFAPNSTHSGVEDCIMRYDIATAYTKDLSRIYLIRADHFTELTGINICNSTIGTGVNSRKHKPQPRYGDAAPGRGDCIHQFCVSDHYD